ncbi:hypothetical protein cypCar_00044705, partial [Cyprinus carpio]
MLLSISSSSVLSMSNVSERKGSRFSAQMSRNNNSDGVKGCMDQMNNSGNTADPSSRGESKNRPSQMDSAGATSQHRSNENGKGAGQERTPASVDCNYDYIKHKDKWTFDALYYYGQ